MEIALTLEFFFKEATPIVYFYSAGYWLYILQKCLLQSKCKLQASCEMEELRLAQSN